MIRCKAVLLSGFLTLFIGALAAEDLSEEVVLNGNDTCQVLLEHYANASAHFIYCAVKHARPITICEACVLLYEDVITAHNEILQIGGDKRCKEQLMNLDRLEVIEEGFLYVSNLWERASCSYCFDVVNGTFNLANSTIEFLEMSNNTKVCFETHSLSEGTYNKSVCQDCEKLYCDMNRFYDNMKNTHEEVCMDIVDAMNVTRMMWNDKLKCKQESPKMDVIYLACSCVMASLPVIFYLGAKLLTTVMRNHLQMQKRLAEVLRPSTSGAI